MSDIDQWPALGQQSLIARLQSKRASKSSNQSVWNNHSINRTNNQSTDQSINQNQDNSTNPTNISEPNPDINQTNQNINENKEPSQTPNINQSINQSTNQNVIQKIGPSPSSRATHQSSAKSLELAKESISLGQSLSNAPSTKPSTVNSPANTLTEESITQSVNQSNNQSKNQSNQSDSVTDLITPKSNPSQSSPSNKKPYEPSPSWCARSIPRNGPNSALWNRPSPALRGRRVPQLPASIINQPLNQSLESAEWNSSMTQSYNQSFNPYYQSINPTMFSPLTSPRSGWASPISHSANQSPGLGIRRLAEQFLNSLPDDSPANRSRSLLDASMNQSQGGYYQPIHQSNNQSGSLRELVLNRVALSNQSMNQVNMHSPASIHHSINHFNPTPLSLDQSINPLSPGFAPSMSPAPQMNQFFPPLNASVDQSMAPAIPHSYLPVDPSISSPEMNELHNDILTFAHQLAADFNQSMPIRQSLIDRTKWAIQSVWSTAIIDVCGSINCGYGVPSSDLDFVVWFDPSVDEPPSNCWAPIDQSSNQPVNQSINQSSSQANQMLNLPRLPRVLISGSEDHSTNQSNKHSSVNQFSTSSTLSPVSTTSTLSLESNESPALSSLQQSPNHPMNQSINQSINPPVYQYFSHAGTLIKLIGGRKKSKVLFRSTKIQVFKDIQLIRLRDGLIGSSIDLWFPINQSPSQSVNQSIDQSTIHRSQMHARLMHQWTNQFSALYPLSMVIKSLMHQKCLNSGYSGLGSFGVECMIVRYLQYVEEQKSISQSVGSQSSEKESEKLVESSTESGADSTNQSINPSINQSDHLGHLLIGFFEYYINQVDYVHQAVAVRGYSCPISQSISHSVDESLDWGGLIDKPDLLITASGDQMYGLAHKRARQSTNQSANQSGQHDDDESEDDEDQPTNQSTNQSISQSVNQIDADDTFTLIIVDPADSSNQIVCHSKALKNMISAFKGAIQVLENQSINQSNPQANQPINPSASNNQTASHLVNQPINQLTNQSINQSANQSIGQSRFHQLLDVNFARSGPSMKLCPSIDCHQFVPVQNKICFNCGHAWLMDKPKKKTIPQKSRKGHQLINQSVNQSMSYQGHHQPNQVYQSINQSHHQPHHHRNKRGQTLTSQSHQSINQSMNQSINHSINQSIHPYEIAGTNGMKFIPSINQPVNQMTQLPYQYPPNYSMTMPLPYQPYQQSINQSINQPMNPAYQYQQQQQHPGRHRNNQSINQSNNFYPNQTYPAYARY